MVDNLEVLYQKLSLTEQEEEEIHADVQKLEDAVVRNGKCLVLRLLSEISYNKEAFKQTMRKAWRPVIQMKFRDLGAHMMRVEFSDTWDKERVNREGPWSFDKNLVLIKEVDGTQQVHQIKFTEAIFWIH